MAIARTAHGGTPVTNTTAGTSQAIATTAAVGETIVVATATVGTAVTTPTDSASNSYVHLGSDVTNTETISFWGCLSNKSASPTVTAHFASSRYSVAIETYSGVLAFNQSNTTTNTGSASPATATLPKALGFASSWSLAAFANKGTATWSASTGNLRANVAGGGTTTPGVAIVDNTTTTSAAAESGSNVWAGTIIELFGSIAGMMDEEISQMPDNADWRSFDPYLAQWNEPGMKPPMPLPAHIPEELDKFDANWKMPQYADIDTESDFPIVPVVIAPLMGSEDAEQRFVGWTATGYDHTSETDEPGGLAIPPFAEPGRFALAAEEVIVGGVMDWVIPLPPTASEETEFYRQPVIDWRAFQYDDAETAQYQNAFQLAPTVFQEEPIEKYVAPVVFLQHEYEEDVEITMRGGTAAVPIRIDVDNSTVSVQQSNAFQSGCGQSITPNSSGSNWRLAISFQQSGGNVGGFLFCQIRDALNGGNLLGTARIEGNNVFNGFSNFDFFGVPLSSGTKYYFEITAVNALHPPTMDVNTSNPYAGGAALNNNGTWNEIGTQDAKFALYVLEAAGLPVPPTTQQDEILADYVDWRAFLPVDEEQLENINLVAAPAIQEDDTFAQVPPVLFDEAIAAEKTPTPIVVVTTATDDIEAHGRVADTVTLQPEEDSVRTPTPPTANDDGLTERPADWRAIYDPTAETDEPGQLGPPAVSIQDDETVRPLGPVAIYDHIAETDEPGQIGPPAVSIQEEFAEQRNADYRTLQPEDETFSAKAPQPPIVFQEEPIEKPADWRQVFHEDVDTALTTTPRPPTVFQEEPIEKNVDWQVKQQDDTETQSAPAPFPPIVQQFEESEQKNADWKALHEDGVESGKTPPPPPPAINQGWDDLELSVHAQDVINLYYEDDARALPPTPPTGQPDIFVEQWVDWRAFAFEDDLSPASPRPPFAIQDSEDAMWRGLSAHLVEDDWSVETPQPPFAIQDQADDSLWRGTVTPAIEDDWRTSAPQPPESADADDAVFTGNIVKFDEVLAAEKTPPPPVVTTTSGDDLEAWFHAAYQSFGQEEDGSAFLPKLPIVQQFEESEQKNIDRVAFQYEDTETQRGSAPTPPVVQQFEESEQKNVDYLTRQYEDTETQQALPAPVPVTQIDEISERYVDWLQPWHEDVETQRALPPPPPTADDFDHSQMLTFVPMAIPFDEADANIFPPPPPPLFIGAGRDDEEFQVYREFTGPYFEAIQEQWIWFSGFIYPTSVIGSGTIQETAGSGSVSPVIGSGQITVTGGPGQITEVTGSGIVEPIDGEGEVN